MTALTKPKLLVLVGPTAIGKTRMSIELAREFNCEIISGDSMQVYRHMDIGTAKIKPEEMQGIPHHLIDIHEPDFPFSVAAFQEECRRLIPEITQRGKLPFIVGGTGLYVESVCYEFQFSEVGADDDYRRELEQFALEHGAQALHDRLRTIDPTSANRLHPNDQRRVIRAMEIYHVSGTTLSSQLAAQKKESPYDLCLIGLTMDRQMLYNRIEDRIDEMLQQGLVEEVASLLERGVKTEYISMQGLGYKEIAAYLQGSVSYEASVEWLKRDTRRYAKRQLSWFRHMKDIHWIDVTDTANFSDHFTKIRDLVAGKFWTDLEYTSKQSK
ncbi:tRNA (adenosine(37)-N6)-dimethylallyltransferase MiaA [Paenibacillus sp. JX-17]|uniref:tRNA dimethylallyltransferase n=1 Tax=Paenibacillus lacisoli TaxID=3064525 RepID=A0ABT9C6Q9_9BACL|nr:tRNA (adenosine(37)-N6)-dimethylallyltransferase MiaA [Paenibacillus sp. JX-17]MDO7904952.1 tRNA (adenosine(37)-N6)-dimethylallyltransferase MiaA [Paenibacillus sp. JX-17]